MPPVPSTFLVISLLLLLVVPGALLVQGCKKAWKQGELCFAVIFRGEMNNYFDVMETGIRDTAAQQGIRVMVLEHSKNKLQSRESDDIFQEILKNNIHALIICAEEEERAKKNCLPLILEANRRNIPVLFIHEGIEETFLQEKNARVACLISSDNVKGGSLAAGFIARKLNGRAKVLMLEGSPDGYSARKRRQGFIDAARKYPAMECIEVKDLNWQRDMAFQISRGMFKKHPDINAVFAFCDSMAIGASDAASLAGIPVPVIVGFDGTDQGKAAVKEKRIAATINQSPYEIGKTAVVSAIRAMRGEKIPYYIHTRTELITEESFRLPFQ